MNEPNLLTNATNPTRAASPAFEFEVTDRHPEVIKEIPWRDIWTPLAVAKRRGNLRIADVFLNSLFAEALFDDEGAWITARN